MIDISRFNAEYIRTKVPELFAIAANAKSPDALRRSLLRLAHNMAFDTFDDYAAFTQGSIIRVRDSAFVFSRMITRRSEDKAKFSMVQAIRDIAMETPRPDLTPAFYAELLYLFLGMQGRGPGSKLADIHLIPSRFRDRRAAVERSRQLDELSMEVKIRLSKSVSGLEPEVIERRHLRRRKILDTLAASEAQWNDWQWQVSHILRNVDDIRPLVTLKENEIKAITAARSAKLPFGITPFYLSLMDDDPENDRDLSLRAQVMPPSSYVSRMAGHDRNSSCFDFMREADTSPIHLITRRYPAICIFKPFNTCPQICVYCQRNWEIKDAMQEDALAGENRIRAAIEWIRRHPAIHEVLITGGDPLAMTDDQIEPILDAVADIDHLERIRIGSRVPVTMPMRITETLADLLARYRSPGIRQVAVVTHIQHPYEINPETVKAVERLRIRGIPVYNQLVYTFYISRRFEAAHLRRLLAKIGVDPYYTFNTKGKDETLDYRVPIARLLQEQKEEARLLPGLSRTDEAVYNVPGQGKNYLRAGQHRDLIAILPDGTRLYEFHPWEKNISDAGTTHICEDVPILDYLKRLDEAGENIYDYETIWYYY